MAKFTSAQADAAEVVRCEAETVDGTHSHYNFGVVHSGLGYEWQDEALSASATKAQIKTAIHDKLTATEKKVAPPVKAVVADSNSIIGNTVGSL